MRGNYLKLRPIAIKTHCHYIFSAMSFVQPLRLYIDIVYSHFHHAKIIDILLI